MKTTELLAFGLLAGGAVYLFTRAGSPLQAAADELAASLGLTPALTPAQQLIAANSSPSRAPGNAPAIRPASNFPASTIIGAGASAGAAGVGAATGAVSGGAAAAAALTAGIAAGAALLAYGIAEKGWFRGGEEGITVNPERDAFLAQFAEYDYQTDTHNPPGFYGLALILSVLDPNDRRGLFRSLTQANTDAKYTAAAQVISSTIKGANASQVAQINAALSSYRAA